VLAFISDLHISDRTAGVHFLSPKAFDLAFRRLADLATQARSDSITLVFLGDVFEMVRTTRWLDDPGATPWAVPRDHQRTCAKAVEIMDAIATGHPANVEIFDILSGSLRERYGFPVEPLRVYLPGNHDRICNEYPELRGRVAELLGLHEGTQDLTQPDAGQPFAHTFTDEGYGVFAFHGHEWDSLAFEGDPRAEGVLQTDHARYMEVPVAEVIGTEIASRLPVAIDAALDGAVDESVRARVRARIHSVDDVRPLPAIVPWLFELSEELEHARRREVRRVLERAVEEELRRVVDAFWHLPYISLWKARNKTYLPWSKANQVRSVSWLLRTFGLSTLRRNLGWTERAYRRLYEGDNFTGAAQSTFEQLGRVPGGGEVLYTVFGHTHHAAQIPIGQGHGTDRRPRVYLNTGTWRALAQLGVTGTGFMSWSNMNLTVLYHPDHDPGSRAGGAGYPTFETWSGSLLDPDLHAIP
jgi:UDP-2,3-diacylglucosamine pyrophosphatase LpxH